MDVFVARQPIFNNKLDVVAYELSYPTDVYACLSGDTATSRVVTDSMLLLGIDRITRGKKAFVKFTANLLKEEIPTLFPNESVVIEILKTVEPDVVFSACKHLKELGFSLALDDLEPESITKYQGLMQFIDIVKVDFKSNTISDAQKIVRQLDNGRTIFLAERVETREEFSEALRMGFTHFQGFFFATPEIMAATDVPNNRMSCLQVMREVTRPEPDFARIAACIEKDVSLSYKLLRLINSAAFYTYDRITSIQHALVLLGLEEIRKWILLIMLRDLGKDQPDEVVNMSLMRGRLCEVLAPSIGLGDRKAEVFLMGIFSLIDVLMNRPLAELLNQLPLAEDIEDALLRGRSRLGQLHSLVVAYERGQWSAVSEYINELNLSPHEVSTAYGEALKWATSFSECR